jgi:hypothetical protein
MLVNMKKDKKPKIDDCIEYIESCGWKLKSRKDGFFLFVNENCKVIQSVVFDKCEIREAYKNGW